MPINFIPQIFPVCRITRAKQTNFECVLYLTFKKLIFPCQMVNWDDIKKLRELGEGGFGAAYLVEKKSDQSKQLSKWSIYEMHLQMN